jgi:hypothetical protein
MADSPQFCEQCGAVLPAGAQFCEQCGAQAPETGQVQQVPFNGMQPLAVISQQPVVSEPQNFSQTAIPNQPKSSSRRTLWIVAVIGLVGLVCLGVVLLGVYFIPKILDSTDSVSQPIATQPTITPIPPTVTSLESQSTSQPAIPDAPTPEEGGIAFFDFSTEALGWPTEDTGDSWRGVQDGMYAIHIDSVGSPGFYLPVDFPTRSVTFDVIIPQGYNPKDSGFGLQCYRESMDDDSFTYFFFDAHTGKYATRFIASEADLEKEHDWIDLSNWNPPGSVNHIEVYCDEYSVALTVNGRAEHAAFHPENQPVLPIRIYASGWQLEPPGFTVMFDNFFIYENVP